jgi:colanic acid biosynthesis glycosyl transferase WcaI
VANVLILSLVFPPDSVSTAEIMGDLAVDLTALGHEVTVLSTVPHYNRDAEAERRQPLRNYWGKLLRRSDYHGVAVYHAAMPAKGRSITLRLAAWSGFHIISTLAGLISVQRPDILLVPSPPLSSGLSAWFLGGLRGAPFIYNVQEIYPDIAVNLGALRNRPLIRLLNAIERFVYRKASAVTVIAPRMRARLVSKGVPAGKLHVVPNFVDLERLAPAPRDNDFSRRYDLTDAFVVSYAGNLGPAQGLEIVIEAARLLADEPAVRFLIAGEGILRDELTAAAARLPSRNVMVLPYQPNSLMPQIYGASDVSLVPQAAATASDAIPSKVYRIMASARPIVAVTEATSDLAGLVHAAGCGAVVAPGDSAGLAAVIRQAVRDRAGWAQMGVAGRVYVADRYGRETVSRQYDQLVRSLTAPGNPVSA